MFVKIPYGGVKKQRILTGRYTREFREEAAKKPYNLKAS